MPNTRKLQQCQTPGIRLSFLRHQSCTSSSSHPVELATTSSTQGAGRGASAGLLASSLWTVLVRAKKGGKLVENRFKAPVASRWASRVLSRSPSVCWRMYNLKAACRLSRCTRKHDSRRNHRHLCAHVNKCVWRPFQSNMPLSFCRRRGSAAG